MTSSDPDHTLEFLATVATVGMETHRGEEIKGHVTTSHLPPSPAESLLQAQPGTLSVSAVPSDRLQTLLHGFKAWQGSRPRTKYSSLPLSLLPPSRLHAAPTLCPCCAVSSWDAFHPHTTCPHLLPATFEAQMPPPPAEKLPPRPQMSPQPSFHFLSALPGPRLCMGLQSPIGERTPKTRSLFHFLEGPHLTHRLYAY